MTLPTGAAHADSWRRTALLRAGGPQTCTHLTKPPQPCCLASLPGQLLAWLSSANTDLSVADRPAKPSGPATARSTGMKARPTPTKAALQATMPSTVSLAPHGTCAGGGVGRLRGIAGGVCGGQCLPMKAEGGSGWPAGRVPVEHAWHAAAAARCSNSPQQSSSNGG